MYGVKWRFEGFLLYLLCRSSLATIPSAMSSVPVAPPPVLDESGDVPQPRLTPSMTPFLISPTMMIGMGQAISTPTELAAAYRYAVGQPIFTPTGMGFGSSLNPLPVLPVSSTGTMNDTPAGQLSDGSVTPPSMDAVPTHDSSSYESESEQSSMDEYTPRNKRKALKARATIDKKAQRSKKTERCSSHPEQLRLVNDTFHVNPYPSKAELVALLPRINLYEPQRTLPQLRKMFDNVRNRRLKNVRPGESWGDSSSGQKRHPGRPRSSKKGDAQ